MTKSKEETVADFKELVNMTADELEEWLKTDASQSAGWQNPSSSVHPSSSGEAVGHASGRHIVSILRSGGADALPDEGEDIEHARRVVAYCKRHLAQEEKANAGKSDEELQETKSYRSLKNWGHDALKKRNGGGGSGSGQKTKTTPAKRKAADKKDDEASGDDDADEKDEDSEEKDDDDDNDGEENDGSDDGDDDDAEEAEEGDGAADEQDDEGADDDDDEEDDDDNASNEQDEAPKAKKAKRS